MPYIINRICIYLKIHTIAALRCKNVPFKKFKERERERLLNHIRYLNANPFDIQEFVGECKRVDGTKKYIQQVNIML